LVKSYETLVDSGTKVDVNSGMVAAGRLQSLMDSRGYSHDLLVMKVRGRTFQAIADGLMIDGILTSRGRDKWYPPPSKQW
jgi:hypothetical protein